MPGTAAEILHDDIRAIICPDKLNSQEWSDVIMAAHSIGLPTTSTMMFGHVENMSHVARHFGELKAIQNKTDGITEFVPHPFVANEAPIYMRGLSRPGPTFKESVLVHVAARIFFYDSINFSKILLNCGTGVPGSFPWDPGLGSHGIQSKRASRNGESCQRRRRRRRRRR